MNVKEAVKIAKDYIADLFSEEMVLQVGLEEVEYVPETSEWFITVGFTRLFDQSALAKLVSPTRVYKVVRLRDRDGQVLSVKDRTPEAA